MVDTLTSIVWLLASVCVLGVSFFALCASVHMLEFIQQWAVIEQAQEDIAGSEPLRVLH